MNNNDFVSSFSDSHFFIHNCMGSFYRGVLNWFGDDFYPRFKYKTIGTYEKTIEFFKKKKQFGNEIDTNILPSISLDPILDFSQDERAGKFLWQTNEISPRFAAKLFDYIDIKEQDLIITPVFSRYQGTLEFTFWLSSIYELIDFRLALLQKFGGYNRIIYPVEFSSFIVLPDSIHDIELEKDVFIDWGNTDLTLRKLDTTNQDVYTLPVMFKPLLQLMSFSDSSTKPGGDQVTDYKLTASINYEINLPTYLSLINKVGGRLSINVSLDNSYTKYGVEKNVKVLEYITTSDEFSFLANKLKFFRIIKTHLESSAELYDFSESERYPDKKKFINWNHYRSGTMIYLNNDNFNEIDISKDTILVIDKYRPVYLPLIRRSNAVITLDNFDNQSLFCKCESMRKPCAIISNTEILDYVGTTVTIDMIQGKIYQGILDSEEIPQTDNEYAYDFLKKFKEDNKEVYDKLIKKMKPPQYQFTKDCLFGNCRSYEKVIEVVTNGTINTFALPFGNQFDGQMNVYLNDRLLSPSNYNIDDLQITINTAILPNTKIKFELFGYTQREFKLDSYYSFKDSDITKKCLQLDLPFLVKSYRDIMLISYNGILEYGIDYELDIHEQKVKVLLPAKVDEMIEFFHGMQD